MEELWDSDYLTECKDHEEFQLEINNVIGIIREYIKTNRVRIDASKINWGGKTGYKVVNLTDNDDKVYATIFPDNDCSIGLYKDKLIGLLAIVSSHDIPTGAIWRFSEVI